MTSKVWKIKQLKQPIRNQLASGMFVLLLGPGGDALAFDKDKKIHFNIPSKDLASALLTYAELSGVQLSYPKVLVSGIKSPSISGEHTPDQALRLLLSRADINYQYVADDAVKLTKKTSEDKSTGTSANTLPAMIVTGNDAKVAEEDPYSTDYYHTVSRTATKTDTPIMETPASIQIVPKALMNDQQNINILDSLNRNVSGVSARTGAGLLYDNFIIRGFTTGSNGAAYRNGLLYPTNFYEPANIEQLEVMKGPAAALYGRVEPGGLINITTKKPQATPYYSLQQQFGSYDLYRTTVDATGPIDDDKTLLYRFNGTYLEKESYRDLINSDRVFIAPSLSWRPNEKFDANLELEYKHDNFINDYGTPLPLGATKPLRLPRERFLGDSENFRNEQENILVGFDWNYHFNENWRLTNRFLWNKWNINLFDINSFGLRPDGRTLNRGVVYGKQDYQTFTTNLDLVGKFEFLGLKHELLIGGDFYHNKWPGTEVFFGATPAVPPIDIYNPVYGQINPDAISKLTKNEFRYRVDQWYGLYFQDQITLFDKLHIMGGGRYDWTSSGTGFSTVSVQKAIDNFHDVSIDAQNFSPRVGLLYQPWQWLSLYGNYTQSFNVNNGFQFGGGTFKPQIGEQFEIGFKTEFFDHRLSTSMAFYHLTKQNTLTPDLQHQGYSIAIGEARSQGIELDIKGQLTDHLNLVATYAYTDTKVVKDNIVSRIGKDLVNVPEHQASVWGTYQLTENFRVGLGEVLVGARQGDVNNSFQLPGYARTDAMVAYAHEIGKTRLTYQVNINNVLNKYYYDNSSGGNRNTILFGEPISVMGSIRLEY